MIKLVNLTPHEIILNGKLFPPSGRAARVEEKIEIMRIISIDGIEIPIIRKTFGEVQNLPAPEPQTIFVVSLLVAQAINRPDVLAIGETLRNEKGQVVGAKSLAVV